MHGIADLGGLVLRVKDWLLPARDVPARPAGPYATRAPLHDEEVPVPPFLRRLYEADWARKALERRASPVFVQRDSRWFRLDWSGEHAWGEPPTFRLDHTPLTSIPSGLHVPCGFSLEGCGELECLPEDLRVDGDLDLSDCTRLTRLPAGLRVSGDLNLAGCVGLAALPDDLSVGGSLILTHCAALRSLPRSLSCGRHLDLAGCVLLDELPRELRVRGWLRLGKLNRMGRRMHLPDPGGPGKPCPIACLPDGLTVGSLEIRGCPNLRTLPRGLWLAHAPLPGDGAHARPGALPEGGGGNLVLHDCGQLEEIHHDLSVPGDLMITHCPSLRRLPNRLRVGGTLRIDQCPGLSGLPSDLAVGGDLILWGCAAIRCLPDKAVVGGLVTLTGCEGLRGLPGWIRCVGPLDLSRCSGLTRLPDGLCVRGDLDLTGCRSLRSLPSNLFVQRNLFLNDCPLITRLPADLCVGQVVDLAGSGVRTPPLSLEKLLFAWHGVRLPHRAVFQFETYTAEEILQVPNVELRRALMEKMGIKEFYQRLPHDVLDHDRDRGGSRKLLLMRLPEDRDEIVCLSVHCPSTGGHYVLRVPPVVSTCGEAAAWVAGFDVPEQYQPVEET